MASYNELNALIDAYINRNGVQAITGQILNGVLKAMVEQLGRGYTIMGAAIPTTDPGTPDGPECYFASETGTYTDFDGLQVAPGELALLCYTPSDGWTKATIYEGFRQVGATIDGNVGTPSVGVSYADGVLSFDFHNMKGNPGQNGQDGAAAGFGSIGADITGGVGTPGVTVESSGPATAKNLQFHFTNLKGETGVTSVVATVDNTTGTPACTVSLEGQQLTLAFSGLKGAQGNTGSSVDYPFTIVNNLTTNDPASALSAAQGVVLDGKVSQLEAKVTGLDAIKSNAEIGGWDITSTDYYRVDNANRVSIGPFRLNAGDKIILSDYSVCQMFIGWKTEDGTNGSSGGWKTADYTVPVSGLYVVTLEGIPAFAVSNTSDLTQYFSIITSSTEADKNTEDVFVLEDAKLNKAVGTNILRSDMPFVASCLLSNTGGLITHSSYSAYKTTKDFIPVSPSTTYARASEGYQYKKICYYDKGLRFLSYEAEKNTFTTPANTAFVRITFYASYGYDMVCKSSSTKPYEPYSEASGYIDGPLKDLREELYNNVSSSYPTKWGKVPFTKNAVSAYAIIGVELMQGHKYMVRIVTSPSLTAPSTLTLKVASASSDTSLANVAQLGGQTISDTTVEFIWSLASGKTFRLGFYGGAISQEIDVYIQDITIDVVNSEVSWDIVARNRHKESALISVVAHGGTDNIKVADKLSLLHLSDLHGNTTKLSAVVKYRDFYEDYLDDTIHTGDSVMNYITDEDPFVVVDGAETILNVIGNHDAWNQGESDYNATEKETYDKIFAPSIANWDVTQPANAATNGYCYYYKDYSPAGFRLIVLDSVHWHYWNGVSQTNPSQKAWFESVLADAITQNLRVVCATHYTPQFGIVPVENTGFNVLGTTPGSAIADGWYAVDEIFGCVDAFINNGGKFAGWLMGHTHNDFFGTVYGHTGQPVVIMGTSGMLSPNNKFVNGTASQDNFNIITFENWNSKNIIKIVKIGQDTDLYLRSKKTICYNFTDGVLVSTT